MRSQKLSLYVLLLLSLTTLTAASLTVSNAQSATSVISIAVPDYIAEQWPANVFAAFESTYPDFSVNVVRLGSSALYSSPAANRDGFWAAASQYAATADILYVNYFYLTPETTNARFYLELTPLINADPTLNADDFVPAVWQSFQWDNGIWALPAYVDLTLLTYDSEALDKAGVAYPTERWTLADLVDAAEKLTVRNDQQNVIHPGFWAYNFALLARSTTQKHFFDETVIPNPPKLDQPELQSALDLWSKAANGAISLQGDRNKIPLQMENSSGLLASSQDRNRSASLLPGGGAGLTVDAFAISSGTSYPEAAYALIKFLTSDPAILNAFSGLQPALKSVGNLSNSTYSRLTPEKRQFVDQALLKAIPVSELRYSDYLNQAVSLTTGGQVDAETALQRMQTLAQNTFQLAATHSSQIVVATPFPTRIAAPNTTSLKVKLVLNTNMLINKGEWERFATEFTNIDSEVKQIIIDSGSSTGLVDMAVNHDCLLLSYNATDSDLSKLLPLDPYLAADPNFSKDDIIGNSLARLQLNNKIWGLPIYITPQVLRYNRRLFSKEGVTLSSSTWTVDLFSSMLRTFKTDLPNRVPFATKQPGTAYILMLIAAYGGLPLDYRTAPLTVNFTDPATVDAIRQVLDLARQGYIAYSPLTGTNNFLNISTPSGIPIYSSELGAWNYDTNSSGEYGVTGYPRGTKYIPLSYGMGIGYISATAANPAACYRWLSAVAKHPELYRAMPARHSFLNGSDTYYEGDYLSAFYREFDARLSDPSAIIIPVNRFDPPEGLFPRYWLERAFDHYVLENADLESELKNAEELAKAFQVCVANVVAAEPLTSQSIYQVMRDCAHKVDTSLNVSAQVV